MIVPFNAFDRYETPLFQLCNPGAYLDNGVLRGRIGILDNTSDEELVVNFNSKSELNFRVYRVDYDDDSQRQACNSLFDMIQKRRLLYLDNFGFFSIEDVAQSDSDDGIYKDVTAYSCEQEIENKRVPFIGVTDDNPNGLYTFLTKDGQGEINGGLLYDLVSRLPRWTIGTVDSAVAGKTRHFEDVADDTNILAFMLEQMQEAYECIFVFDTVHRIISAYDRNTYLNQTSIHLTRDDLINELKIDDSSDDLYTALEVRSSGDETSISGVSPTGMSVIYNFDNYLDWIRQSQDLAGASDADELADKVAAWQAAVNAEMVSGDCYCYTTDDLDVIVKIIHGDITPTPDQTTLYDMDGSGTVTSFDAGEIATLITHNGGFKTESSPTYYDLSVAYYKVYKALLDAQADINLYTTVDTLYERCIENIVADYNNDAIHGYLEDDTFYEDAVHAAAITLEENKYYYDNAGQQMYAYILNSEYDPTDPRSKQWILYPVAEPENPIWDAGSMILSYAESLNGDLDELIVAAYYHEHDDSIPDDPATGFYMKYEDGVYSEPITNYQTGVIYFDQTLPRAFQYGDYIYTEVDLQRVREIEADASYTPTETELSRYDIDNSGVVDAIDATAINNAITNNNGVISGFSEAQLHEITGADTFIAMVCTYRDNNNALLTAAQNAYDTINDQLTAIASLRAAITDTYAMDKYFTPAELGLLEQYIFEGTYTDEYVTFTDSMDWNEKCEQMLLMYQRATEMLDRVSQPTKEFTVDVENFAFQKEYEHFTTQLAVGSLVNVELTGGDLAALFLTAITINWDDCTLELTFGNRLNKFDTKSLYQDALGSIQKSANSIEYIYEKIKPMYDGEFQQMQDRLATSRNLTKDNALGATNQTVVLDDTGLAARRLDNVGGYMPEQIRVTNNSIVITDDGWKTAKVAIGKVYYGPNEGDYFWGLNSEVVAANLFVGDKVWLTGEMTVYKDQSLQTVGGYLGYENGLWKSSDGGVQTTTDGMVIRSPMIAVTTDSNSQEYHGGATYRDTYLIVTTHGVRATNEWYYPALSDNGAPTSSGVSLDPDLYRGRYYIDTHDYTGETPPATTIYQSVENSGVYVWSGVTASNYAKTSIDGVLYVVETYGAYFADGHFFSGEIRTRGITVLDGSGHYAVIDYDWLANRSALPAVTSADNGKILIVKNGAWTVSDVFQYDSGTNTLDIVDQ